MDEWVFRYKELPDQKLARDIRQRILDRVSVSLPLQVSIPIPIYSGADTIMSSRDRLDRDMNEVRMGLVDLIICPKYYTTDRADSRRWNQGEFRIERATHDTQ